MAITLFERGFTGRTDITRDAVTIAEALAMTVLAMNTGERGDAAAPGIVWAIGIVANRDLVRALEYVGAEVTGRSLEGFREAVGRGTIRPLTPKIGRTPDEGTPRGEGSRQHAEQRAVVRRERRTKPGG